MTLNLKQLLAFSVVVFSVLAISTTGLGDIFGPHVAKSIAAASNILNAIFGGWLGVITGQAGTVKDVLAMPGIESLKVNAQASQTLAQIAIDPTQQKIEATPEAKAQVTETANQ